MRPLKTTRKDAYLALLQKTATTKETAKDSVDMAKLTGDSVRVACSTLFSLNTDKVLQRVARRSRRDSLGRTRETYAYYAPEIVERPQLVKNLPMDASALCAAW